MKKCSVCGSHAINHNAHGRDGSEGELCDVCFWRKKHGKLEQQLAAKDALLRLVKELLPDVERVESEYDGQSYYSCPSCGANDLMTALEHRKNCLWAEINTALAATEPKT